MVRGAHSTVPDHLCHHPRPPSQADAVKVILHLSSCSHREIKARVVGMVKREPNYIYNIKVSAFVACCSPGFFISRKTQISIFHFHILTRKIACSQLRPIAFLRCLTMNERTKMSPGRSCRVDLSEHLGLQDKEGNE